MDYGGIMPLGQYQDHIHDVLDEVQKTQKIAIEKHPIPTELLERLNDATQSIKWTQQKIKLSRKKRCDRVKYVNKYEVFNCDLGHNVKSELNKLRPCIIWGTIGETAVVVPIRSGSMISYDSAAHSIQKKLKDGTIVTKSLTKYNYPVTQDSSYVKPWIKNNLRGYFDVSCLRTISFYRIKGNPIAKIDSSSIEKINELLVDFLNIDISKMNDFITLEDAKNVVEKDYEDAKKEIEDLNKQIEILKKQIEIHASNE